MTEKNTNPLAPYKKEVSVKDRKIIISQMLIGLRKSKNLLQKDVANAIGIPLSTYGNYEKALSEPPAEILIRLAYFYSVPLEMIVGQDIIVVDTTGNFDAYKEQNEITVKNIKKITLSEEETDVFIDQMIKMLQDVKSLNGKKNNP